MPLSSPRAGWQRRTRDRHRAPGNAYHPDRSPDGARIAFDAETGGGNEIWVINPDGTDAAVIVPRTDDCAISWTPDGSRIIFTLVGQQADFDNPRKAAFIEAKGSKMVVIGVAATHPRLRPGAS